MGRAVGARAAGRRVAEGVIQRPGTGHAHVAPRHSRRLHNRAISLQPDVASCMEHDKLLAMGTAAGCHAVTVGGMCLTTHSATAEACKAGMLLFSRWAHLLDAHAAGGRRRRCSLLCIAVIEHSKPGSSGDGSLRQRAGAAAPEHSSTFQSWRMRVSEALELPDSAAGGIQHTKPCSSSAPGLVGREALGGRALLGQLRRRPLVRDWQPHLQPRALPG